MEASLVVSPPPRRTARPGKIDETREPGRTHPARNVGLAQTSGSTPPAAGLH